MSWKGWLLGAAAVVAIPSALMESKEPGSSLPYRESLNEATHGVTESLSLTAQDVAVQAGPVGATLAESLRMNLNALNFAAAPTTTTPAAGPSLPTPVQSLPDPGAQ